jgi:hypothetical protein
MGRITEEPDWVDDTYHLVDRTLLKHHTDGYIRQLLTGVFDEMVRRNKINQQRKELVSSISKIESDW